MFAFVSLFFSFSALLCFIIHVYVLKTSSLAGAAMEPVDVAVDVLYYSYSYSDWYSDGSALAACFLRCALLGFAVVLALLSIFTFTFSDGACGSIGHSRTSEILLTTPRASQQKPGGHRIGRKHGFR